MLPYEYSQNGAEMCLSTRLVFLLLILSTGFAGCAVNPVTGKNELSWISKTAQISIGEEQYLPSQQSQGGIYLADPDINKYVTEVGHRVVNAGDLDLPYEFVVLNNSVPNAWSLPGGKIGVNRGLLLELNNEAELAAVLGHEAVHAAAKHGTISMQRSQIVQVILKATELGTSSVGYGNYIVDGAQVGLQLITQKFGRQAEFDADYYGIKYISNAGYEPRAAVTLQETFLKLSMQKNSRSGGLFASHPPSVSRIRTNLKTITDLALPHGDLFETRYQQKIAFLKATKPAYDKYDSAQILSQNGELESALKTVNEAIKLVPNEARFLGLQGSIYYQQARFELASDAYNQALALDDGYFEYYLGRGLTYKKQGNIDDARRDLERSNQLLPTAIANHTLGQLSLAVGDRRSDKAFFQIAMDADGSVSNDANNAFARLDQPENPVLRDIK